MTLPTVCCRFCGRRVAFVKTAATGKLMPLDPQPNDDGNVFVTRNDAGQTLAVVLKKGETPPIGTLFMPHYATCPNLPKRNKR